jgi:hypothetical protein
MTKMTLNKGEISVIVTAMEAADFGKEIEIEIVDEWDGQPDEYTEWQDFMGGDEYYDHSESTWD